MSLFRRAPSSLEKNYLQSPEMCTAAIKVLHSKDVPMVLDGVINSVIGLRLRLENGYIVSHDTPYNVVPIPNSITDLEEVCNFMDLKATPDFSQFLATVGSNDKIIAFHSHHICCDGGFIQYVFDNVTNPSFSRLPRPKLPQSVDDLFLRETSETNAERPFTNVNEVTTLKWRHGLRPPISNERSCYAKWHCPMTNLQCYDQQKKKIIGLTEQLWSSLALSIAAYNQMITNSFCIETCIDLRPFLNPKLIDLGFVNYWNLVRIQAKNLTPKSTIEDIGQAMRSDFEFKKKNGGFFIPVHDNPHENSSGSLAVLSNMGRTIVDPLLEDVWGQQEMPSEAAKGMICFLAWTKERPDNSEFWGRLRYSPQVLPPKEADALGKSIAYVLEKLPKNTPMEVAIQELIKLQKTLIE